MTDTAQERQNLPKRRTITLPEQTHQPSKAEQEKEHHMPGVPLETARRAFFRPVTIQRKSR